MEWIDFERKEAEDIRIEALKYVLLQKVIYEKKIQDIFLDRKEGEVFIEDRKYFPYRGYNYLRYCYRNLDISLTILEKGRTMARADIIRTNVVTPEHLYLYPAEREYKEGVIGNMGFEVLKIGVDRDSLILHGYEPSDIVVIKKRDILKKGKSRKKRHYLYNFIGEHLEELTLMVLDYPDVVRWFLREWASEYLFSTYARKYRNRDYDISKLEKKSLYADEVAKILEKTSKKLYLNVLRTYMKRKVIYREGLLAFEKLARDFGATVHRFDNLDMDTVEKKVGFSYLYMDVRYEEYIKKVDEIRRVVHGQD